ncbi:MAG: hypothetical protein EKK53_16965 [Burkholderiales bacterium]|jgi:hypothetical protein|nr:hypothetical protein [Burkholderiaceae bacterium]RTL39553.1 MAG: hypothetical protein EKK53_16965 [Burkholderiales bacterium]
MNDAQTEFLANRVLELLGGREAAIASMEAEYHALKERWKQDVDTIGRILRAHLHVEYYLTEHLQHMNPMLGDIDGSRLSFAQKANLLTDRGDVAVWRLIGGIRHLNKIRNRLAHNLKAEVTEEDRTVFLSQDVFKMMRVWGHKDDKTPLSDAPIDVLEHFAEFASSMLHSATTPHSKAFKQAMEEWAAKNT